MLLNLKVYRNVYVPISRLVAKLWTETIFTTELKGTFRYKLLVADLMQEVSLLSHMNLANRNKCKTRGRILHKYNSSRNLVTKVIDAPVKDKLVIDITP